MHGIYMQEMHGINTSESWYFVSVTPVLLVYFTYTQFYPLALSRYLVTGTSYFHVPGTATHILKHAYSKNGN